MEHSQREIIVFDWATRWKVVGRRQDGLDTLSSAMMGRWLQPEGCAREGLRGTQERPFTFSRLAEERDKERQ